MRRRDQSEITANIADLKGNVLATHIPINIDKNGRGSFRIGPAESLKFDMDRPRTYRLLRSLGFRGVAITDSLSLVHDAPVERWARQATRAGADLVLFTDPGDALRAVRALVPLARRGELDAHVLRVLRYREAISR